MNLSSPNLYCRVVLAWVLAIAFLIPAPAMAAAENLENADSGKPFASVWRLRGDVYATGKRGSSRKLQEGGTVYVGEKVRATPNSEAVLKTGDAGIVAVRPGAEFIAERFAAEGKASDHQILRLITGSLRVISGWISKLNRGEHQVVTPSATIGIRGTDHEPYVLPAEMASATWQQGTYDKVNRGATELDANGGNVVIDSGKVGFARDPHSAGARTRGLMTLLFPVVLAKVPEFFVPGGFDQEIDRYSEAADAISQKQLDARVGKVKPAPVQKVAPAPETIAVPETRISEAQVTDKGCSPLAIGRAWLNRFDRAVEGRDIKTILDLFAPEIVVKAIVRSGGGTSTLEFGRVEFVQSTLDAVTGLKDYQQRRVSLEAALVEGESVTSCKRVVVTSMAIEQGLMNGRPYHFEALEEYRLEQRKGEWVAVKAQTTQR